ncbi:MAG: hypothetical protein K2O10_05845, partial [Muribaculaceae bacterium]|nr:hypothetical protein [Muribaculaceae bacterium]
TINIDAAGSLAHDNVAAKATLSCAQGLVDLSLKGHTGAVKQFDAELSTRGDFMAGDLLADKRLGVVNGNISAEISGRPKQWRGSVDADLARIDFNGNAFTGLTAQGTFAPGQAAGHATIDNQALRLDIAAAYARTPGNLQLSADGFAECPDLGVIAQNLAGYALSTRLSADLEGDSPDWLDGHARLNALEFTMPDGRSVNVDHLSLIASTQPDGQQRIALNSDLANGLATGHFDFRRLPADCRHIAASILPALITEPAMLPGNNNFDFGFTLNQTEPLAASLRLPASVVYPATLRGHFGGTAGASDLTLDIPYLRQGTKLVENTALRIDVSPQQTAKLFLTTTAPTQNGPMTLTLNAIGADNTVNTDLAWKIDRARAYEGSVSALTTFLPSSDTEPS